MSQIDNAKTRENFPTFRRFFARLGKLPFVSRAWWKRNFRRVGFVFLFLGFSWTATNIYATFALNRELAAIKQRGEPLTMAELAPPTVNDKENAAMVYKNAAELLKTIGLTDDDEQKMMEIYQQNNPSFSRQDFVAMRRRLLAKSAPAIALVRQGAALPSCVFPRDWNQSASMITFPEYSPMRKFARLMSAQAKQDCDDGKIDKAIANVAVIYRLSEHLSNEHIAIGLLVRRSIEMIGHEALAHIFENSNVSVQQKVAIENTLPRADLKDALKKALQGERAFATAGFDNFFSYDEATNVEDLSFPTNILSASKIARVVWSPMTRLDKAWFLRAHPANPQAVPLEEIPSYAFNSRALVPVFSGLQEAVQVTETMRDMAHIALALKLWQQTHNAYPKSLQELKSMPITSLRNALSRKTIGFKTQGDKFLLYSFGLNGIDDGGKSRNYDPIDPQSAYFNDKYDDLTWRQSLGEKKRDQ